MRLLPRLGWLLMFVATLCAELGFAQTKSRGPDGSEQRTSRYFDSIRQQPPLLLAFLREMPKGADLHNHLGGAIYAESFIDYAAQDGLCVDRTTSILIAPPCDNSCDHFTSKPAMACSYGDHVLYNSIIDAWSMRNWKPEEESGHDHFFATFDKFSLASHNHAGDMIAEAASRAAEDHVQYLELMHTADGAASVTLGMKTGWDDQLPQFRDKLLAAGLRDIAASTSKQLDTDEAHVRSLLKCGTPQAQPGCEVTIRYLYQVLRGLPREAVFAQILLGFELASSDPRFVGLNLVMPEDWYIPMRDFELHMKMLDYLHGVYPKVHISLHAGELTLGLVPPEGLRFHIRDSIEKGHAERIGHGVDVMYEHDSLGLLREMARRNVMVEVCLTSNDVILGVKGKDHPLSAYKKYGVPVALATDDQGVSRVDMTHEYVQAVEQQELSYLDLKRMARTSLEHSFLPGTSLWSDTSGNMSPCEIDLRKSAGPSRGCKALLDGSEKARAQWKLEKQFAEFEKENNE